MSDMLERPVSRKSFMKTCILAKPIPVKLNTKTTKDNANPKCNSKNKQKSNSAELTGSVVKG